MSNWEETQEKRAKKWTNPRNKIKAFTCYMYSENDLFYSQEMVFSLMLSLNKKTYVLNLSKRKIFPSRRRNIMNMFHRIKYAIFLKIMEFYACYNIISLLQSQQIAYWHLILIKNNLVIYFICTVILYKQDERKYIILCDPSRWKKEAEIENSMKNDLQETMWRKSKHEYKFSFSTGSAHTSMLHRTRYCVCVCVRVHWPNNVCIASIS